jgi:hypothetical protein
LSAVPELDLTLIVCGAPLTSRTPALVVALMTDGWRPTVVATPGSLQWLDGEAIKRLTGEPPRLEFRLPTQTKRDRPPAAVVVCPATFNTVNKAAAGINDSYAMGVLCEAIGVGTPTVLVPMVNNKLWGHPVWARSLGTLVEAGVAVVDVQTGSVGAAAVTSGTGDAVVAGFDPQWVIAHLAAVRKSMLR